MLGQLGEASLVLQWLKCKYGDVWQIDFTTLSQTCHGTCHVLTMVEATTGWLGGYNVSHVTTWDTIPSLEKQVLGQRGTPERIESDSEPQNRFTDTWVEEHSCEWV